MPRRCTVCDHIERHGIDEALVSGAPYRSVAKRFGLSESAVYRHKTEHLPAHLLNARACYELGQKSHRNADFTVSLVPSRSLFPAFLSRF